MGAIDRRERALPGGDICIPGLPVDFCVDGFGAKSAYRSVDRRREDRSYEYGIGTEGDSDSILEVVVNPIDPGTGGQGRY